MRKVGRANTSLRDRRIRKIDRRPCTVVARGCPEGGRAASTSARVISRSESRVAAQLSRTGRAKVSWERIVSSERGLRRGGVVLPLRITSSHTPSSRRIGSGSGAVLALNQRTTGGSMSSSSIPAAPIASVTVAAECLMRVSSRMSLRRIGAPGVSWMPSMIRMPRWMVDV